MLEFVANALTVARFETKILVVERAQHSAADDGPSANWSYHSENQSDARTLAYAALADLLGLDLTLVVQDQDADGVAFRDLAIAQRTSGGVGRSLAVESRQNEHLVPHEAFPS